MAGVLPDILRQQAQRADQLAESIRQDAGHRAEDTDLAKRLDELAGQILTLLNQDRQLTDGQSKLTGHLDALDAALTGQIDDLATAIERHGQASARRASALKWMLLGAIILAATACTAAVSTWLLR